MQARRVVAVDNGVYGETGMQLSHTSAGVDLVGVSAACRFAQSSTVTRLSDATMVRVLLHEGRGPILVRVRIATTDVSRVLPTRDGHELRQRFATALRLPSRPNDPIPPRD